MNEALLDRVTISSNAWQRNIYSSTVVVSRVSDTGVWVAEIMACCLTHLQYDKHSYPQSCEF